MLASREDQNRMLQLADLYVTGSIDQQQSLELNELLSKDSSLRQQYVHYMDLHAELACQEFGRDEVPTALKNRSPRRTRFPVRATSWMVLVGCMSFMISCLIYWQINGSHRELARVVNLSHDASWLSSVYQPGDLLRKGEPVRLETGTATLKLNQGATVTLSAPAEFVLLSDNEVYLNSGQLLADVPEQAHGFSVETRDGILIDLGTRFLVSSTNETKTQAYVIDGSIDCFLYDSNRRRAKQIPLTSGRFALLDGDQNIAEERLPLPELSVVSEQLQKFDGIEEVTGITRMLEIAPADLVEKKYPTENQILVIPEQKNVTGTIPQITLIQAKPIGQDDKIACDSYLIHFDPGNKTIKRPIGSIRFRQPIVAIFKTVEELTDSDAVFGLPKTRFSQHQNRGLETGEDQILISADGKTISFQLDLSNVVQLDQFRVLVQSAH